MYRLNACDYDSHWKSTVKSVLHEAFRRYVCKKFKFRQAILSSHPVLLCCLRSSQYHVALGMSIVRRVLDNLNPDKRYWLVFAGSTCGLWWDSLPKRQGERCCMGREHCHDAKICAIRFLVCHHPKCCWIRSMDCKDSQVHFLALSALNLLFWCIKYERLYSNHQTIGTEKYVQHSTVLTKKPKPLILSFKSNVRLENVVLVQQLSLVEVFEVYCNTTSR